MNCERCGNPIPLALGALALCPVCNPVEKYIDIYVARTGYPTKVEGLPKGWRYRVIDLSKKSVQTKYDWVPGESSLNKFNPPKVYREMAISFYGGLINVHNIPKGYEWSIMQAEMEESQEKCPDLCANKDIECHKCHEYSHFAPIKAKGAYQQHDPATETLKNQITFYERGVPESQQRREIEEGKRDWSGALTEKNPVETIEEINIPGEEPWGRVKMSWRVFKNRAEVDQFIEDFNLELKFYKHEHAPYWSSDDVGSVPAHDTKKFWVLKDGRKVGHLSQTDLTHPEMMDGRIDEQYTYSIILTKDGKEAGKYEGFDTVSSAKRFASEEWLGHKYDDVKFVPSVEPEENPARKINQKSYKFYVVCDGKILAGNEYKEDAKDEQDMFKEEMGLATKVYTKKYLKQQGIDPDKNDSWGRAEDCGKMKNPMGDRMKRISKLPKGWIMEDELDYRITYATDVKRNETKYWVDVWKDPYSFNEYDIHVSRSLYVRIKTLDVDSADTIEEANAKAVKYMRAVSRGEYEKRSKNPRMNKSDYIFQLGAYHGFSRADLKGKTVAQLKELMDTPLKSPSVHWVEDYYGLGFGENGMQKDKNGRPMKIHRDKSGNFGLGWKDKFVMGHLAHDSGYYPRDGSLQIDKNPAKTIKLVAGADSSKMIQEYRDKGCSVRKEYIDRTKTKGGGAWSQIVADCPETEENPDISGMTGTIKSRGTDSKGREQFTIKLDNGESVKIGRGFIAATDEFMAMSSAEMRKVLDKPFYGHDVGDRVSLSQEEAIYADYEPTTYPNDSRYGIQPFDSKEEAYSWATENDVDIDSLVPPVGRNGKWKLHYFEPNRAKNPPLNVVEVIFDDPQYNYTTSVSATTTEESARDYYVGHDLDVGIYPEENMQRVKDIKFRKGGAAHDSLLQSLKDAGVPDSEIDRHESDLYVRKTPISTKVLDGYKFRSNVTTFVSQTDRKVWYDVPFAYGRP